ncbi:MAG TPA: hypothetical protein VF796_22850 [Humisphaera sp.]
MEGIELVMKIEDEFRLTISDEDAERLQTVGETVDYLLARARYAVRDGIPVCHSARAFYTLRRGLVTTFGAARGSVRPETPLGRLLPGEGVPRRAWNRVAVAAGMRPEPFRFSKLFTADSLEASATVGELIRTRLRPVGNYLPDEQAVYSRLVRIVADVFGVHPSKVSRETHYVNDLL